jgi:hypothetical protein
LNARTTYYFLEIIAVAWYPDKVGGSNSYKKTTMTLVANQLSAKFFKNLKGDELVSNRMVEN